MSNLLNQYEFKGVRLQPFSKGRLTLLQSAGVRFSQDGPKPGAKDILAVVFVCLCDYKVRALAQMDPAMFWEKLEEWENSTIDGPADYQAAGELATALLNDATSTKAEPMETGDLSALPDPIPNEPSQTI
jgi:hypothetical protein